MLKHLFHNSTLIAFLTVLMSWVVTHQYAYAHGPRYTHIATSAQIAEDPHQEWTAKDVAAGIYDAHFRPVGEPVSNLNFTTSTWWVKFNLKNGTRVTNEYYLEAARPLTNVVNLYRISELGAQLLYQAGDDLPYAQRPIVYRKPVFPITLAPNDSISYLLEVASDGEVINLPIKLWDTENFHGFVQRENLVLGLYYGLLIFVIGLFLFFALVAKQRIYSYYVSYVAFLMLMQASLDGLAFEYLWPNWTWMANHAILLFSGASVFMIMLYAAEFLNLPAMPKWYQITYKGMQLLVGTCMVTSLTSGILYELTYPVINGMSLVSLLMIIMGIIWNQKANNNLNVFFALGFLSVLVGGILFIFTNFNIIYSDFISQNALKLGSAAEITFLSLAMVGRYRDVQREKEVAQKEAFENLEKLNQVTKEQNIRLEVEVAERTAEIRVKSEELAEKNKEIIDSINYAKRIQEAILPPNTQWQQLLPNSFVLYLPKDIVAGDFYWLDAKGENTAQQTLFFAAADCTGHGVPGAMVSVVCHNALNRAVREFNLANPAAILDKTAAIVDETFEKSTQEVKDGMDISLVAWQPHNGTLEWAGANNPLWIISKNNYQQLLGEPSMQLGNNNLYELKADKQPIGRYPNRKAYTNHVLQLLPGDCLYVFSDGFSDQFGGENGKKFKSKNFKRLLLELQNQSLPDQKEAIFDAFHKWRGAIEQVDDVCVIGFQL
jgi:serine phosphatase RsbU (regulator of sigma subunit)